MIVDFLDKIRIGIAYNSYFHSLAGITLDSIDYLEVPYELLNHYKGTLEKINKQVLLHCASLSLAGYTKPSYKTIQEIGDFIKITETPWLGEHLAFITAERLDDRYYEEYAPDEPYNIGYTVSPVMNLDSVSNIIKNLNYYSKLLNVPIIVENSPLYFSMPGSTMSQIEFINTICNNSETKLLLDLTHFFITSKNCSFDVKKQISKLPLEKVVEIHISGVNLDKSIYWDNHASKAPKIIFDLLDIVLKNCSPQAITLEYNWDSNFEISTLKREIEKVKRLVEINNN